MRTVGSAAVRVAPGRLVAPRVERPWRVALRDERARPAGVAGPRDFAPLARAVADFMLVVGLVLVGILAPG